MSKRRPEAKVEAEKCTVVHTGRVARISSSTIISKSPRYSPIQPLNGYTTPSIYIYIYIYLCNPVYL